jgi:hypothetical protein
MRNELWLIVWLTADDQHHRSLLPGIPIVIASRLGVPTEASQHSLRNAFEDGSVRIYLPN